MTTRYWLIMAALMVGLLLSPLNVMFTSVALPTMRGSFQIGVEQVTWIGTAYFIPSVALMPFQSQLGNRWGVRRIYSLGLTVLAAGALLAALAPTFQLLLASRVVQGVGWSALYPLALTLINREFPAGRQGEMMGLWESSVGLTTIIAPLIGGVLVQYLDWRSLYIFMALVAAAGVVLTRAAIPKLSVHREQTGMDWLSGLILTTALTLTLIAISRKSLIMVIVGGLVWVGWAIYAGSLKEPSIPPGLFRNRRFVSASLAAHIRMLVAVAALTALPLFFEDVQSLSPAQVGLILVVYSVFLFFGSWPGGRWSDRAGAGIPGIVGYLAMIIGTVMLLGMKEILAVSLVAAAMAIRGIGAGLSQAPYAKAATESVPATQAQAAAGLYGTIRYSGLAVGTTLVGVFLSDRLDYYAVLDADRGALLAYNQLWLVLAAVLALGLGASFVMTRSQPVRRPESIMING